MTMRNNKHKLKMSISQASPLSLDDSEIKSPEPPRTTRQKLTRWHCCNLACEKELVTYIVQVAITIIILVFCMINITREGASAEQKNTWIILLSTIAGNFLPTGAAPVKQQS